MATERIDIIVSERGTRVVKRNIADIGSGAKTAQGGVQLLTRALGALGVAFGVRELVQMVDNFTNLQNRLRTVTDGTAELAVATDKLFAVANRTRSSFEGTVEVFSRTALAVKDLGISQQETINFTESLNQAVLLSGASAQEANNAMIQLSQGLASGTLRGDELRSVLEQLPVVADVIAEGLGVTRGQLREMGEQGKITAQDILRSFKEARGELEDRFAESVPTIGQAFTVLRNNITQFIGSMDGASGASTALAKFIILLSDNVELLARAFAAASIVIGVKFAKQAVGAAITAVLRLTAVIAANPIGAIVVALTTVIALLISFSDKIKLSSDGAGTLADFFVVAFQEIKAALGALVDFFKPAFDAVRSVVESIVGPIVFSFGGILRGAASIVDGLVGVFNGAFDAIVATFTKIPRALGDLFFQALNGISKLVQEFINTLIGGINTVTEFAGIGSIGNVGLSITNPLAGAARDAGETAGTAFLEGFQGTTFATDAVNRILTGAEARAQDRLRKQREEAAALAAANKKFAEGGAAKVDPATVQNLALQNFLRDLNRETELLKLNSRERAIREALFKAEDVAKRVLTKSEKELITTLITQNMELENQAKALEEINAPLQDYEDGVKALDALLAKGAISTSQFAKSTRELRLAFLDTQTDALSGLERGILRVQEKFGDLASLAENTLVNAFSSAEDAMVKFVTTGKFEFGSLVTSIAADLTRLAVRQSITGPLASLLGIGGGAGGAAGGGLFGGLFSGIKGLFGFQNGGSFTVGSNTGVAPINGIDNRLVAFRAQDGENVSITPRGQQPGGSGRNIEINFNITDTNPERFGRSAGQLTSRAFAQASRFNKRDN